MELPKNITQIGETNPHCKIYVEDYVVSYIKQLNQYAQDKKLSAALYGTRREEKGVSYLFLYGTGKLNFLQRESRHLSQAVLQEAEKLRKKHFSEYDFLGYCLLNGEMVEGFYVYEQGVCRYIAGYAQFYEKNDSMLAFMLEERQEDVKPEEVSREKYDEVKRRQEERRAQAEQQTRSVFGKRDKTGGENKAKTGNLRRMQAAAAAVFALLCVTGLASMSGGEGIRDLQSAAKQLIAELSEQRLPDTVEVSNGSAQVGTIVAEDKLTEALLKENSAAQNGKEPTAPSDDKEQLTPTQTPTAAPTAEPTTAPTAAPTAEPTTAPTQAPTAEPTAAPVSYTVKKGDTLIGICIKKYGSDTRVSEICNLNGISNPDNIKAGQKILLP